MRIGIYGGSFDPIHLGHLWVAEAAKECLGLDRVLFIPAAISPLKQDRKPIEDRHRVEMLKLAISGVEYFGVDERELHRGGVSYTIDTLRELKEEHGGAELYFIMGSDSLADFGRWRSTDRLECAQPLLS
jgi:nicotinate-nucleotide adenylyltransferase